MFTVRVYTRELRESAAGLVLFQGLSIRVAAEDFSHTNPRLYTYALNSLQMQGHSNTSVAVCFAARSRSVLWRTLGGIYSIG